MFHTYSIVKTARLNVLLLTITTITCTVFVIVNSRFLERLQKRSRGSQFIHWRLLCTYFI